MILLKDYYVQPHDKVSREVVETDLPILLRDAEILYNLCFMSFGAQTGALAVAHPQIDEEDPMRFFVTQVGEVVINPEIINHTGHTVDSEEGCLSFPWNPWTIVQRWNKCVVKYQTIAEDNTLTEFKEVNLSGKMAKVFQHEIDHLDGKYIYDN